MNRGTHTIYEFGAFRLDPDLQVLLHHGEPVVVWPKVFATLVVLLESRGRIVEKEELMQALWPESFVEESNLVQNIFILRKILGDDRNRHSFIQTVPRRGYKFVAPVREAERSTFESDLPASYWRGRSPFRGLQVFETKDAWLFFGRESETEELLTHMRRSPVLSVVGNSGSGKSSLLCAGLIPALQQGRFCPNESSNEQWRIAILRPSAAPFDCLAEVLLSQLAPELSLQVRAEFIHEFRNRLSAGEDSLRDAIAAVAGAMSQEAGPIRILLLVDQFEEIFTLTAERRIRDAYIDCLLAAARLDGIIPVHLALAVRADFYPECIEHPGLSRCMRANQYIVGRMSQEQLRESMEKRLQLASARAEAGLIDSLLEDVGSEPGNLALLEHALGQLWEKCGGFACTLTNQAYAEIGRLRGALGRHADEVYAGLRDEAQQPLAKKIFLDLVHLGDGAPDTRRRVPKAALHSLGKAQEIDLLLAHLASSRLISTSEADHEGFVEVSHEALIREWPLLREWLTQNRDDLRLERRLLQAAEEWKNLNRDRDALLQGARLAQAEEWLGRHVDVPVLLQDFVQTSIWAREEARERELARQRAAAVRLRWFSGALTLLLLLAIGASWFIYRQDIIEKSRAMAAQSGELLQKDHGQALDLAIRSWETAKTEEGRQAVIKALPETLAVLKHEAAVITVKFSPDGQHIVSASADHTARVWDAADGHLVFTLRGHTDKLEYAEYSPDNQQIITTSDDHTARLWSGADGHLLFTLRGHTDKVMHAAFSHDGKRIVTESLDNTARIWSTIDGRLLATLPGNNKVIGDAEFSPDGQRVVTAGWDDTARVWNSADGHLLMTLQHSSEVVRAVFLPDNQTIVSLTFGGKVQIWSSVDGKVLFTLPHDGPAVSVGYSSDGQKICIGNVGYPGVRVWSRADGHLLFTLANSGPVNRVAFSRDDRRILTSSVNNNVAQIWDSTNGNLLATLQGHSGPIQDVAFSPDGERIVTASDDQTIRLWMTTSARTVSVLHARAGTIWGAVFSPDGRWIATCGSEKEVQIWDAADRRLVATLKGHTDAVECATFSPDSRRIVTTSYDQTARVWNAADGQLLTVFRGHSDRVWGAQFSYDSQRIVTTSKDGTAAIWAAADGRVIATFHDDSTMYRASFSRDGKLVLTTNDNKARIWDANNGQLMVTLRGHTDRVSSAEFSRDGQRVVTASFDHTARVWSALNGRLLMTLQGHTDTVQSAWFSYDGKSILTASTDRTARLWSAADGRLLATFRGHADTVWTAFFSRDDQRVITASLDNTARVWNTTDRRLIAILRGHSAAIYSARFSPDGQRIITSSQDSTVRIWQLVTLDDVSKILAQ